MEFHAIDIILHLINIAVLFVLLRMWVFKPVQSFMAARQDRIAVQVQDANTQQIEASNLTRELNQKLASVNDTCEQIISESRQKGSDAAQKIIDSAEEKANTILTETRQVAQAQRRQIMDSAKVDLADLAITMAERVLTYENTLLTTPVDEKEKTGQAAGVLKLAVESGNDTVQAIQTLLENRLGTYLELSIEVDDTLLGGFAAYIDGQVYDFSYATQLSTMKQSIA